MQNVIMNIVNGTIDYTFDRTFEYADIQVLKSKLTTFACVLLSNVCLIRLLNYQNCYKWLQIISEIRIFQNEHRNMFF